MARPAPQRLQPPGGTGTIRPPGQARTVLTPGGWPTDVIELITADHRRIRRLCEAMEDAVRCTGDPGADWMLAHVWQRLAGLLEAHLRAEEEICYPRMFGAGPQAAEWRREAIADHDDIREAISEASLQRVGTALWWRAVRAALATVADHLGREERGILADCLPGWAISERRELGRQWWAFIAAWTLDGGPPGGVEVHARRAWPSPEGGQYASVKTSPPSAHLGGSPPDADS